jgi:hypothetical protein
MLPIDGGAGTNEATCRCFHFSNAGPSMSKSPGAFIAFDTPVRLRSSRIAHEFRERYPGVPGPQVADGANDIPLMKFAGVELALIQLDVPVPANWQPIAKGASAHWPEAEAVFGRHRAHVMVATMGADGTNRLHVAQAVSSAIGAILETHPESSGVLWDQSVIHSRDLFGELSRWAFSPYPDFPTALWVSIHPFRTDGDRIGAITRGLSKFVGREIELLGSPSQFKAIVSTARRFSTYLVQGDKPVKDGDTFGENESERILVQFGNSDRFGGLPIIAATLPSA